MALWDDIAKSAKDAAAYTAKKAGELTNVAKLKMSIRSEENNLDKCFAEIGNMYYAYQREGEDHTAEIAALLMEADQIVAKIDSLRTSLAKVQNSSICPGCNAQVTTDFAYCPLCGEKLDREVPADDEEADCDNCSGCCGDDATEE